jgi:hypothetical protein
MRSSCREVITRMPVFGHRNQVGMQLRYNYRLDPRPAAPDRFRPVEAERKSILLVPAAAQEASPAAESRREVLGHEPGSAVIAGATVRARISGIRTRARGTRIAGARTGRTWVTVRRSPDVIRAGLAA